MLPKEKQKYNLKKLIRKLVLSKKYNKKPGIWYIKDGVKLYYFLNPYGDREDYQKIFEVPEDEMLIDLRAGVGTNAEHVLDISLILNGDIKYCFYNERGDF